MPVHHFIQRVNSGLAELPLDFNCSLGKSVLTSLVKQVTGDLQEYTRSPLVQVIVWHLFSAKPLTE